MDGYQAQPRDLLDIPCGRRLITIEGSDDALRELFHREQIVHSVRWVLEKQTFHSATLRHWIGSELYVQSAHFIPEDGHVTLILGEPQKSFGAPLDSPLLDAVMAHADNVVLVTEARPVSSPGPRIVYANPAFTEMTGYPVEAIVGETPRILQGPDSEREALDAIRSALESWNAVRVELTNYRSDGRPFIVELDIRPISDATGWYTHWIAIQRDVTRLRLRELRRLRAERLETVRGLAGGVAHDFNNLLVGLTGSLTMARQLASPATELAELLDDALWAARRSRELTHLLRVLFDSEHKEEGTAELLAVARRGVSAAFGERALDVTWDVRSRTEVRGDSARLGQVFEVLAGEVLRGAPSRASFRAVLDRCDTGDAIAHRVEPGRPYVSFALFEGSDAVPPTDPRAVGGDSAPIGSGVGLAVGAAMIGLCGGALWTSPAGGIGLLLPAEDG